MADIKLNSIEDAVKDFQEGKFVIVVDDEDRENEGDLITICKLAETSKTYSYHSGRHSFASLITLEAGVLISLKNIR